MPLPLLPAARAAGVAASVGPGDSGSVRPYVMTRGRTAPGDALGWETLVSTTWRGAALLVVGGASPEEHRAAELCTAPRSAAEVAALLRIPIGVSRIVLADLARRNVVSIHEPVRTADLDLIRRMLDRLRRL
jgi:hypothetical protein